MTPVIHYLRRILQISFVYAIAHRIRTPITVILDSSSAICLNSPQTMVNSSLPSSLGTNYVESPVLAKVHLCLHHLHRRLLHSTVFWPFCHKLSPLMRASGRHR